jgi:hypothetical protein
MGLIAAPLLAGVSVALTALVIQNEAPFYCPNVILLCLVGAAIAFGAAVQFAFRAREFAATPPEIEMWWANPADPEQREELRVEQRYHRQQHQRWANRARHAYNIGLLGLLLGLVALLIPREGLDDASFGRVVVVALAVFGLGLELAWIGWTYRRGSSGRKWPPPPGPESGA